MTTDIHSTFIVFINRSRYPTFRNPRASCSLQLAPAAILIDHLKAETFVLIRELGNRELFSAKAAHFAAFSLNNHSAEVRVDVFYHKIPTHILSINGIETVLNRECDIAVRHTGPVNMTIMQSEWLFGFWLVPGYLHDAFLRKTEMGCYRIIQ